MGAGGVSDSLQAFQQAVYGDQGPPCAPGPAAAALDPPGGAAPVPGGDGGLGNVYAPFAATPNMAGAMQARMGTAVPDSPVGLAAG